MSFTVVLVVLTQQYKTVICEIPRDEYTGLRKYYKTRQGLTSIPSDIPADASEVYIKHNPITKIEAKVFSNLSECTKLVLGRNEIFHLEPESFDGLTALKSLKLNNNSLEQHHVNIFPGLKSCKYLYLDISGF